MKETVQRKPRITLATKLQVIRDYKSPDMTINAIIAKNHVSLSSVYRIIRQFIKLKEGV